MKLLIAPMLHFSFIGPYIIFLFYKFKPISIKLSILILFITFFYSNFVINLFDNSVIYFGEALQSRITTYSSEEYLQNRAMEINETRWFMRYYLIFPYYGVTISILMLFAATRKMLLIERNHNNILRNLFSFYFLISSYTNLMMPVAEGERYIHLSLIFGLSLIVYIYASGYFNIKIQRTQNLVLLLMNSPLVIFVLVKIRQAFDMTDPMIFLLNPFLAIFREDSISIIQFLK